MKHSGAPSVQHAHQLGDALADHLFNDGGRPITPGDVFFPGTDIIDSKALASEYQRQLDAWNALTPAEREASRQRHREFDERWGDKEP